MASGASFDAESEGSIAITVTATSDDGSTSQESFTLTVNEVPTDLTFDGNEAVSVQPSTKTFSGLSHEWNLEGNANDEASTYNGTVYGATTVEGKDGDALRFDEVNDYATIPDVAMANEFTISFQFKIDENVGTGFQCLYSHGDINSTNSINVFISEDAHGTDPNVMRTVIRDGNDTLDNFALQFDISSIIGDGEWHTYTLTVQNGVGSQVYLDGALQNTDTRGSEGINPSGPVYLGARQDLRLIVSSVASSIWCRFMIGRFQTPK